VYRLMGYDRRSRAPVSFSGGVLPVKSHRQLFEQTIAVAIPTKKITELWWFIGALFLYFEGIQCDFKRCMNSLLNELT